jgi:hypothetical protein
VRLIIAALSLLAGATPIVFHLVRGGLVGTLLQLCWIISGVASGYLLFRWFEADKKLFGGNNQKDTIAFFVSVVSGINLGLTGILYKNIGMSLAYSLYIPFIFAITGIVYVVCAWYLYSRWQANGKKLF